MKKRKRTGKLIKKRNETKEKKRKEKKRKKKKRKKEYKWNE